ncbi:MAG: polysaccharide deacetylase family protein [Bacilli bacterium]|nr:polysaccharide deacetylase family protein [Bacilli bacterium]
MSEEKIRQIWIKILFIVFIALIILLSIPFVNVDASGFGYSKNDNHEIPEIGRYKEILHDKNAYYVGQKDSVYLTFDAGYDNGVMPDILKTLREKKVQATFFVTGDFVNRFTPLLKQIIDDGHLIGNHSYSHKAIDSLSKEELLNDLNKLEEVYFDKTNSVLSKIFRPPEGRFNEASLKYLNDAGYKTFFWSIALVDWKGNDVDSYREVMNNLHDGAIILLHSVSRSNADALGEIIDGIRNEGYEFKLLTEI